MGWQDAPVAEDYDVKQVPAPRSGIPEPGPSSAGEDVSGIAKAAGRMAKISAAPTIGSVAVPAAITALTGPANMPFIPLEQGLGSFLGEGFNQLTGITEPSMKQLGMSAIVPIATGYGMNALRGAAALPKELNTKAPQMATDQMKSYAPIVPSSTLFEKAEQMGTKIAPTKTKEWASKVLTDVDISSTEKGALRKVLKDSGFDEFLASSLDGLNPKRMQRVMASIGKLVPDAKGYEGGQLKTLFSSMVDDLDTAANAPGAAATLKLARDTFKREAVLDDVGKAINSAFFVKKGVGAQGEFSANKVLNTLRKTDEGLGKFFSQSFSEAEQKEIKDLFGFLNTLPSLKPGAGVQYGSGAGRKAMMNAIGGGGVGGGIGFALGSAAGIGGPAGAAVGGGLGVLAPAFANASELVMQAWKMPGGRQLVRNLLMNKDGVPLPHIAATLSAFVTGAKATPAPAREIQPIQNPTQIQPMGMMP